MGNETTGWKEEFINITWRSRHGFCSTDKCADAFSAILWSSPFNLCGITRLCQKRLYQHIYHHEYTTDMEWKSESSTLLGLIGLIYDWLRVANFLNVLKLSNARGFLTNKGISHKRATKKSLPWDKIRYLETTTKESEGTLFDKCDPSVSNNFLIRMCSVGLHLS